MNDVRRPRTSSTAPLSPLLIVFGVALARRARRGVRAARPPLRRAGRARRGRSPRGARRDASWSACQPRPVGGGAAHGSVVAEGAVAVDGPALFTWGMLLVLRLHQRAAVRRAPPRGRRQRVHRPGRRPAGHRGRARGVDAGPRAHRGLPAGDVRARRHDAVPDLQRPADDVRRARGAVAAAVPAVRPGPPSPAAQPGGRAEVLPARRLLARRSSCTASRWSTATPAASSSPASTTRSPAAPAARPAARRHRA